MNTRICPNCLGRCNAINIGWKCERCNGVIDMRGRFHEHKEEPFMPPMTNADRIRAMSDEELADIFLKADFCKCCEHEKDGVCNYICTYPNIPLYDGCKQAALKWMKQPAEEDA